ncbi:MAG: RHS repeat-associated core domain-containing protein, partial [Bacteroidota bacterium]
QSKTTIKTVQSNDPYDPKGIWKRYRIPLNQASLSAADGKYLVLLNIGTGTAPENPAFYRNIKLYEASGSADAYREVLALNEHHLYGSSRLGIREANQDLAYYDFTSGGLDPSSGRFSSKTGVSLSLPATLPSDEGIAIYRGLKLFELSEHRGNVMAVLSDRKLQIEDQSLSIGYYFTADIRSTKDYYAFGMEMMGRGNNSEGYRYGFQGQEQDEEMYGGAISYKYRIHDPRIGKFLSVDPLAPKYPFYSQYAFSGNRVIDAVELEGLEPGPTNPQNEHGESQIHYSFKSNPNYTGSNYRSPGEYQKETPRGRPATGGMGDVEVYQWAVRRVSEPGEHLVQEDAYVDERLSKAEDEVRYFLANLATVTMVDTEPMRQLSSKIHSEVLMALFSSNPAYQKQAVGLIQNRSDVAYKYRWSDAIVLLEGGYAGLGIFLSRRITLGRATIGEGKELLKALEWAWPKSGYTDFVAHGSANGMAIQITENGIARTMNAKELADMIRATGTTGNIRLLMCNTGCAGENSIAQGLANELGVTVLAPSEAIHVYEWGIIISNTSKVKTTGKWINFKPQK